MTFQEPHIVAIDVETTGLRGQHCITEVGAYAIHLATRQLVSYGEIQVQLTPQECALMSPEAAAVQGWTPERNATGVPLEAAREQIRGWLKGYNLQGFIAHNADFDRYHLQRQGFVDQGQPWYCTRKGLVASEGLMRVQYTNHKLASLAEASGFVNPDPHRSGADALTAAMGYLWLTSKGVQPQSMRI